jgi:ABC-type multidrug transport system ATPase subunit
VLGRPGSGCTSLLRIIANDRSSFPAIEGEIRFGSADHTEAEAFRHQVLFNSEDDIHFPTLTVAQTIRFALRNKAPDNKPSYMRTKDDFAKYLGNDVLEQLGISHTDSTLVGNEYVRGVSGGERKRVSVAEVMAGQVRISAVDS